MEWPTATHNSMGFIQYNIKWKEVPNDFLEHYTLLIKFKNKQNQTMYYLGIHMYLTKLFFFF